MIFKGNEDYKKQQKRSQSLDAMRLKRNRKALKNLNHLTHATKMKLLEVNDLRFRSTNNTQNQAQKKEEQAILDRIIPVKGKLVLNKSKELNPTEEKKSYKFGRMPRLELLASKKNALEP